MPITTGRVTRSNAQNGPQAGTSGKAGGQKPGGRGTRSGAQGSAQPGTSARPKAPTKVVISDGPSAEGNVWSGNGYRSNEASVASGSGMAPNRGGSVGGQAGRPGSIAMVVTRNGWQPSLDDVANAKRKQPCDDMIANKVSRRVFEGGRNGPNRDVFVLNLEYTMCKDHDELSDLVKEHCRARGVGVVNVKVFTYEYDLSFANCRVTFKELDESKVLQKDFWPARASARAWLSNIEYRQRQRGGKVADEEGGSGV